MLDLQLSQVRKSFPDIPRRALDFFNAKNAIKTSNGLVGQHVMDFYISVGNPTGENTKDLPPENVLKLLLDRLVGAGLLRRTYVAADGMGFADRFLYIEDPTHHELNLRIADFIAYGLPSVVDAYGSSTFQLIPHFGEVPRSGTAFVMTPNCILTAAHCVRKPDKIQICGLSKDDLAGAEIVTSRSETLDCAAIILKTDALAKFHKPIIAQAEVLDEVVLLGYPNIPTLLNVRVAEKANIATVLRGAIASDATDIFKTDLLLITAPVRGGFSGGPVISHSGYLLGMISRQPWPEMTSQEQQLYDAAGFGLAIPMDEIQKFLGAVKSQNTKIVERRLPSSFSWAD